MLDAASFDSASSYKLSVVPFDLFVYSLKLLSALIDSLKLFIAINPAPTNKTAVAQIGSIYFNLDLFVLSLDLYFLIFLASSLK